MIANGTFPILAILIAELGHLFFKLRQSFTCEVVHSAEVKTNSTPDAERENAA